MTRRFLRRVGRRREISEDGVSPDAFRCRENEEGLSLYLVAGQIEQDGIVAYQRNTSTPDGDCVGLCLITDEDIRNANLLLPWPDEHEGPYGKLHYLIACPDENARRLLAAAATQNGIVRRHYKKGKFQE